MADNIAGVLAQHQRRSIGMTGSTPDTCSCGQEVMPVGDEFDATGSHIDILDRRDAGFAAHQADALAPKEIDAGTYRHEWSGSSFAIGDTVERWNRIRGRVTRIFKKSQRSRWYVTIDTPTGEKTFLASDVRKVGA